MSMTSCVASREQWLVYPVGDSTAGSKQHAVRGEVGIPGVAHMDASTVRGMRHVAPVRPSCTLCANMRPSTN